MCPLAPSTFIQEESIPARNQFHGGINLGRINAKEETTSIKKKVRKLAFLDAHKEQKTKCARGEVAIMAELVNSKIKNMCVLTCTVLFFFRARDCPLMLSHKGKFK
jgi:hypothetical protein